jgi:hypothetical protein
MNKPTAYELTIPDNPVIKAFDEKKPAVRELTRKRNEISRQKELRRHEFSLERHTKSDRSAFLDSEGRDVGKAAYEEEMRELDVAEGKILRELLAEEKQLESLKRERSKTIEAANREPYLDILGNVRGFWFKWRN